MTITDYLKIAATQLRRASDACKYEIGDLRRTVVNREQDTSKKANQLKAELAEREVEIRKAEDDTLRALHKNQVSGIQKTISQVKDDFENEKQQKLNRIREVEQLQQDLSEQANKLERQATGN